jgi:hypothetical protein
MWLIKEISESSNGLQIMPMVVSVLLDALEHQEQLRIN